MPLMFKTIVISIGLTSLTGIIEKNPVKLKGKKRIATFQTLLPHDCIFKQAK